MKKLFSIFCCLLLSASVVTQAQLLDARQQHPMRGASRVEKAVATNLKIGSSEATGKVESTSTPVGLSQRHNVAPRRNGVPSGYYYHDDEDEGLQLDLSTMTMDLRARKAFVDVYYQYSAAVDVYMGLCFFHPETPNNAIPSGNYTINKTQNDFTMYAGEEWGTESYSSLVIWNSSTPSVYWQIYKTMTEPTVYVVNPYNEAKPRFILVVAYDTKYNTQAWYELGTEPAYRTVILNEAPDGNGNYVEGTVDLLSNTDEENKYWEGTRVTITPHPASGCSILDGFTGAGSEDIVDNGDGTYSFVVGAKDYNISPTWRTPSAGTTTANASPAAGGSVTVSPSGNQPACTDVTLTPVANPGYVFTGWADGGNANPRHISVDGDHTYTANFALLRTITTAADPVAYGSVTGGGSYADGATATLTATANSGYKFLQWSDGNTSNPRSFTVNASTAAVTYTAQFIRSLHDFEYHFTYEQDFAKAATGQAASGGSSTQKYYSLRLQMLKNYVATNAVAYPAIAIEIVTTQTSNRSGGYKDYNSVRFPYPATFTNTTTTINYNNRGKIVTSANSGSNFTKFYDANGTAYIFQSGTIKYTAPVSGQTYPFVHVDGTFGGKTVWVTIGTAPSYSITLDNQSATTAGTASVTATYTENTNLTSAITIPIKTGYNFGGYYTSKNGAGSQIIDASGNFIGGVANYTDALKRWLKSETVTLYAKWTAKTYTVNLNSQEATTAGTASVTATYNAAMPSATMPTKTGYAFNGYYTSTNGGGTQYYTAAGASARNWNIDTNPSTLYAYWTQKNYTLSATTNPVGLGSVTFSKSAPYHYLDEVTLTAPEVTGYTFSGWGGTNSSMMSGNVFTFSADAANNTAYAVTANYTANPYTITLNNQSATAGGTSSQTVDYRTALPDITVPTKTGNAFGGYFTETNGGGTMLIGTDGKWVKNVSGYTDASGNLIHADNFELFAKWTELVTFTIASYSNGTVTVTPNDDSGAFTSGSRDLAVGTMVSFSAVANTNYHISTVNLNINGSDNSFSASSAYTLKTGDGTVTLTADFLPDTYTITYRDQGDETYSGDNLASLPDTHTYNAATALVDGEKGGYNFLGWYDNAACTGDALTTIGATAKTADFTLYAKWEVAARTVTITAPTGGTITVTDGTTAITSGSQAYSPDIAITLTATPADDYEFVSWNSGTPDLTNETTENGVVSGIFTLTDNTTVGATFRRVRYYELTLLDNESADYYNTFATQYNGVKVDEVTYTRTFAAGRWSTVCLPFTVAVEEIVPVWEQVYEFVRATGDANTTGDGMMLYFRKATTLLAGKCYLVYNTGVSEISSTTFTDVTINTTADKADITSLEGYKDEGDISLVGTLRKGTLPANNHSYMALSNNTIYWPGDNGITVRAYRGFFKDADPSNPGIPQRVRIVVEGEVVTDLEIMENGELRMENDNVRKYIEDGVLIIERNGIRYDAQGKRIEN